MGEVKDRRLSRQEKQAVRRFLQRARDFCCLLDGRTPVTAKEFPLAATAALTDLCLAALRLPDVDPDDDPDYSEGRPGWPALSYMHLLRQLEEKMGRCVRYRFIHDPFAEEADEEPCMSSLEDDLDSIYHDLTDDRAADAIGWDSWSLERIWQWKFDFMSHWGNHAYAALYPLKWIVDEQYADWDEDEEPDEEDDDDGGDETGPEEAGWMRTAGLYLLRQVNRLFPLPRHPFNLAERGEMTYAEWQLEQGERTIAFYLPFADAETMFAGKRVLDIGCGAGGKTLFYARCGAEEVVGVDLVEEHLRQARELAERLGLAGRASFVLGDAVHLDFITEGSFDTIIANDLVEHLDYPGATLVECAHVLRPGGRLYLNFPPYYHPYGAHLSDAIGIPWVHALASERLLVQLYKELVREFPDGEQRIALRTGSPDGRRLTYINKMTVARFRRLLRRLPPMLEVLYYREVPLRPFLALPARLPGLKEFLVKMVVCVLGKVEQDDGNARDWRWL